MAQFATPFVRLRDYLEWAKSQGCNIQTGFVDGPDGMQEFNVVTAKSGRYVVIHDLEPGEAVPASAFEYYDRRLGLKPSDPLYGTPGIPPTLTMIR